MTRDAFLAIVGDPNMKLAEADALDRKARELFATVKDEFFDSRGKRRKKELSDKTKSVDAEFGRMTDQARVLRTEAHAMQRIHDGWMPHTRPDLLRRYGLEGEAQKVEAAYRRFIEEVES